MPPILYRLKRYETRSDILALNIAFFPLISVKQKIWPPVEGFGFYLEKMRSLGFSTDEIRLMVRKKSKKKVLRIDD